MDEGATIAPSLLDLALEMTFLFCVSFAIIADFRTLLIPNWIALALVAAFAVFAAVHLGLAALGWHVLVMAAVLALSVAFYLAGWIGGGDVKFLSAVSLWMGPAHVMLFALLMALIGAVLAIGLVAVRLSALSDNARLQKVWVIGRILELARAGQCPYGIAIGVAALVAAPSLFGFR
jgi:prepilin peptidase CpaA